VLSYIAYPNTIDKAERRRFETALVRYGFLERATMDKEWARSLQKVRPQVFLDDDTVFSTSIKNGTKKLGLHMITALYMVLPHINTVRKGKRPLRIDGLEPNLENIVDSLMSLIGLGHGSRQTFESRRWAPTKPIVHVAVVFGMSMVAEMKLARSQSKIGPLPLFHEWWTDPALLRVKLQIAEKYRIEVPRIEAFKIKEKNTIQFLAV
jgi:hypothetical protein